MNISSFGWIGTAHEYIAAYPCQKKYKDVHVDDSSSTIFYIHKSPEIILFLTDYIARHQSVFIIIAPLVNVRIQDTYIMTNNKDITGALIKKRTIIAQENSQVNYVLDNTTRNTNAYESYVSINSYNNSVTDLFLACTGSPFHTITLKAAPLESNASIYIKGIYVLFNVQNIKFTITQEHTVPDTVSDVHIQGIVGHKAKAHYEGLIDIAQNADNTIARQQNKNIVIGKNAYVYTQPRLQVRAHRVQCSHGAAVGRCNAQTIAYMQSRGLTYTQAQKIFLEGFLSSLFEKLDYPQLATAIKDHLAHNLVCTE